MKIVYWNCASGIINKMDLIKEMTSTYKLNLLFISASNIGEHSDLQLINIDGYETLLPYKQHKKSRILAYMKSGCGLEQLSSLQSNECLNKNIFVFLHIQSLTIYSFVFEIKFLMRATLFEHHT